MWRLASATRGLAAAAVAATVTAACLAVAVVPRPEARAATPGPSTTGTSAGVPPGPTCETSVQPDIDAAPDGAQLVLPGCVIRETLRVSRPIVLRGVAGTEIRGSDVWTDWQAAGGDWRSAQALPDMPSHGECLPGTTRCLRPEQVFRDGVALAQVEGDPGPDEFSVDADRRVRLGEDPSGRVLEVSVRPRWVVVTADGVTIERIAMRHATNDSQSGALSDDGHAIVVREAVLSDAHGANAWLTGRSELLDSEIANAGQLGIGVGGARVAGNRIHHNGTEGFDPGWEAGGFKAVTRDVVIEDNEVDHNAGSGIWFDIGSSQVTVRNNRVHANLRIGIFIEISSDVRVTGNVVWDNGREQDDWLNGAGILVHSSTRVEVADNLVAWNGDGIGVASQDRPDRPAGAATGIRVHDNTIWMTDGADTRISLGWVEDWPGPMFDPASGNTGERNRFWYPAREGADHRFAWHGPIRHIATFTATPGGRDSSYLSDEASLALLHGQGLPVGPAGLPGAARPGDVGPLSQDGQLALVGGLLAAVLVTWAVAVRRGAFSRRWLVVGAPLAGLGYVALVAAIQQADIVPDPADGIAFVALVGAEIMALGVFGLAAVRATRVRRPAGGPTSG